MSTVHYELQKVRIGHFLFKLKGSDGEIILASETFCSTFVVCDGPAPASVLPAMSLA